MAIRTKPRADEGERVTVSYSDSIDLVKKHVQWSPKGVSLLTKWPFQVGAEVEFAFDHQGERHCCKGVVVACRDMPRRVGFFETVLYFVERPGSKVARAACDCRLAHERDLIQGEISETSEEQPSTTASSNGGGDSHKARASQTRR